MFNIYTKKKTTVCHDDVKLGRGIPVVACLSINVKQTERDVRFFNPKWRTCGFRRERLKYSQPGSSYVNEFLLLL